MKPKNLPKQTSSSPPLRKKEPVSLEKHIRDGKLLIDTSSLLHEKYPELEKQLFPLLKAEGKQLIVPRGVVEELEARGNKDARYALRSLGRHQKNGLVVIAVDENDNDTTNVFLTIFTNFRIGNQEEGRQGHQLTLITQDADLAHDIFNLNRLLSQGGRKAFAYGINKNGSIDHLKKINHPADLNRVVKTSLLFIDTNILTHDKYPKLEKELFPILKKEDKKLIVPNRVIRELEKLAENPDLTKEDALETQKKAKYAMKSLARHQKSGSILIGFGENDSSHADNVFLTQFTSARTTHALSLISQDVRLARDLLNLNKLRSQKGLPVSVYRLTEVEGKFVINNGDVESLKAHRAKVEAAKKR